MTSIDRRAFSLLLLALGACGGADGAIAKGVDDAQIEEVARDASSDAVAADAVLDDARIDETSVFDAKSPDGGPSLEGCTLVAEPGAATSKWASIVAGKLEYATLPKGDRLLDFSYAGYMGGGVAIPKVAVQQTVKPSGGDDTKAIQDAIDAVSKLPITSGVRGAVLLSPGTFEVAGALSIGASGVVLRGSGSGSSGTTLHVTGAPRTVLHIGGSGSWKTVGAPATITDDYVPSGARTFHVDRTDGLSVGARVLVDRPVTTVWIHFLGMDALVRHGGPETWLSAGTLIHSDRTITAIAGDQITVDAPISDSFDAAYVKPPGATVVPYTFSGRIEQVGLESMRIAVPAQTVPISAPTFTLVTMDSAMNGWIEDVVGEEPMFGFVLDSGTKNITIQDSSIVRTAPIDGSAGYPFHYSIGGQQILVQRSSSKGANVFSYATQARTPGPNVVLNFRAEGSPTNLQPHQRWATGLLVDGLDSPTGGVGLMDRGYDGSGHGWAIGFGVVWNGTAASLLIQQPPGAQNWAIGAAGKLDSRAAPGSTDPTPLPSGIIDSHDVAVAPKSLYLSQLCLRLGKSALGNIGY